MTIFKDDANESSQRLDWQILQNGWASLYWQKDVLSRDLVWFEKERYEIKTLNCAGWVNPKRVHEDLKKAFAFPAYFGENLAALNDCLSDLVVNDAGLVVVFEQFQTVEIQFAHNILDIFADNSRRHMLLGKTLLTLIQVDDPNYTIPPIGATSVQWNSSEWLNKSRNL